MPRLGNEWRSTSTLSVYLHFVHRQIFIFASYYLWSWFQYIILLLFHSTHCTPWDLTWFGNFYNYALCDFEEFGTSVLKNEIMNSNNLAIESSWNVMALGDARKGKWRGNWRMEWVASTLHTTSEHGVLLPLMRTPRLPVVDWNDAPADLNILVRFAERRNLVPAPALSHFKCSLHNVSHGRGTWVITEQDKQQDNVRGMKFMWRRAKHTWQDYKIFYQNLIHWGRVTQICVFNTRLFSLHNTLNYAIHRACLRMALLTDVYRNLTSLWIKF